MQPRLRNSIQQWKIMREVVGLLANWGSKTLTTQLQHTESKLDAVYAITIYYLILQRFP
jgi:hypothetical protein